MSEKAKIRIWPLTRRFLLRVERYRATVLLTILIILCASGAKVGQVYIMKPLIDSFGKSATGVDWNLLKMIGLAALGLALAQFVFGYLQDVYTNWLTKRVVADLRNDVTEHLSYLPLRFHHDRKAGDLISRVTNDIAVMEPAANFYFDDLLVHPAIISYCVGLLFLTNWQLTVAVLVFIPLYVLPISMLGRRLRKARKKSLERLGNMTETMLQTFSGIKAVKAFGMEREQVHDFRETNESYLQKLMAAVRRKALSENMAFIFLGLGIVMMFIGGGFLIAQNKMTAGQVVTFGLYVAMINTSIRELGKSWNRLVDASTGCERVFELLDQPRETEHDDGDELATIGDGVEYSGVTFAYDTEPVLRDIELKVTPGEVVALVGPTGAGKSTLCDLLCRFYDPTRGRILIGGRDLRTLKRSSLLRHVAVVAQDPFLFNTSIGENIAFGKPGAAPEEIERAAKVANIHDFIAGLEKKYATVTGERGAKLSGGQRQRIAIARAVLKDPDILILDEATSALDSENEKLIQEALHKLIREGGKKRITFVIAHRLSTIRDADRIVVLKEGRIVEIGSHEKLLASQDGVYSMLYRTQFAS